MLGHSLVHSLVHSLTPFTHLIALHCSLISRAPLSSLVSWLTRFAAHTRSLTQSLPRLRKSVIVIGTLALHWYFVMIDVMYAEQRPRRVPERRGLAGLPTRNKNPGGPPGRPNHAFLYFCLISRSFARSLFLSFILGLGA